MESRLTAEIKQTQQSVLELKDDVRYALKKLAGNLLAERGQNHELEIKKGKADPLWDRLYDKRRRSPFSWGSTGVFKQNKPGKQHWNVDI
jgi:hypothetical protein